MVYRLNNEGISVKNQGCENSGLHPCIVEVFKSCFSVGFYADFPASLWKCAISLSLKVIHCCYVLMLAC